MNVVCPGSAAAGTGAGVCSWRWPALCHRLWQAGFGEEALCGEVLPDSWHSAQIKGSSLLYTRLSCHLYEVLKVFNVQALSNDGQDVYVS
jgi:hypothetical protein